MADAGPIRRGMFAPIEPFATGALKVSALHTLYHEQSGSPDGLPVVSLHGGPGGGVSPDMRRFFDPDRWRIILFDQRGCGRSTPYAELAENTTWDLVADIERLRTHLGIERWVVSGGSWGVTLALAYAAMHPERVSGLILRGVFLATKGEIAWFYQSGARHVFPDAFDRFESFIPAEERGDLVAAYARRLASPDRATRIAAARAWATWEGEALSLRGPEGKPTRFTDDRFVEAFARIESHYFTNAAFFECDGWLLDQVPRLAHIPARIVHGRYDMVTPASSAYALAKLWPNARLEFVPDAGHASLEPGIVDALVRAGEDMARLLEA